MIEMCQAGFESDVSDTSKDLAAQRTFNEAVELLSCCEDRERNGAVGAVYHILCLAEAFIDRRHCTNGERAGDARLREGCACALRASSL